jgi:uncharacterized protein YbjQ (UPF0145 family)
MEKLLITSGFNFEGYRITDYLDYCSGECALGTGFLSSLGASFADFTGGNSTLYSDKLNKARNIALEGLMHQARIIGANALIGVTVNYTAFSADIMGVVSNGTAVRIEKIADVPDTELNLQIYSYNPSIPIRPLEINLRVTDSLVYAKLMLFDSKENNIQLIDADVILEDAFSEQHICSKVYFSNFETGKRRRISSDVLLDVSAKEISLIKKVQVKVNRYLDGETAVLVTGENVDADAVTGESLSSAQAAQDFFDMIQPLNSAQEVYACAVKYNEAHDQLLDPAVFDLIQKKKSFERLYGVNPGSCVRQIKEYFQKAGYISIEEK